MVEGTGAGVYGQSLRRRISAPQAETYAILVCVYKIVTQSRPQKYLSICPDNQAALKAIQTAKTTFPLAKQFQKALNDISTRHAVELYWVSGQAGVRGNEIACKLARGGSTQTFIGPEPSPGVSRRNINNKIKCWGITSIWQCGVVHVVPRDRLEN
jgi:ribonuclease HI